jgi:protein-disulfide isomerase
MTDDEMKDQADEIVEKPVEPQVKEPPGEELPETAKPSTPGASWWVTAAIGAAMLVVGLFLGYVGRGSFGPEAVTAKATQSAQAAMLQTQQASNQEIMDMLIKQTRHFRGEATAPVTIIEFSDFQ